MLVIVTIKERIENKSWFEEDEIVKRDRSLWYKARSKGPPAGYIDSEREEEKGEHVISTKSGSSSNRKGVSKWSTYYPVPEKELKKENEERKKAKRGDAHTHTHNQNLYTSTTLSNLHQRAISVKLTLTLHRHFHHSKTTPRPFRLLARASLDFHRFPLMAMHRINIHLTQPQAQLKTTHLHSNSSKM